MVQHPFYRKLDSSLREIRLLTILSDADDSPIRCTLRTVPLDSDVKFNAISYCWGASNITTPIQVDNCVTQVTFNLEQGLRRLRRSWGPREIWVDVICVNQVDIAEKNLQVPLMRDIYYTADQVLVWLGESDTCTDKFIRTMKDGSHESIPLPTLMSLSVTLVLKGWWKRTWTVQEFFLAKTVHFMCGTHTCSKGDVNAWFLYLFTAVDKLVSDLVLLQQFKDDFRSAYPGQDLDANNMQLWSDYTDTIRGIRTSMFMEEAFSRDNLPGITVAMESLTSRVATDSRDKVFGLMGLMPEDERRMIKVDYLAPPLQVYYQVVSHLWPTWYYFEGMKYWRLPAEPGIMPSWVPDLSEPWNNSDSFMRDIREEIRWKGYGNARQDETHQVLTFWATDIGIVQSSHTVGRDSGQSPEVFVQILREIFMDFNNAMEAAPSPENPICQLEHLRTRQFPWEVITRTGHEEIQRFDNLGDQGSAGEMNAALWALLQESYAAGICRLQSSPLTTGHDFKAFVTANMLGRWGYMGMGMDTGLKKFLMLYVFFQRCRRMGQGTFFTTSGGFMGCSPSEIRNNDRVVIPHGAAFPFVLRPKPNGRHRMIGAAYISGFADLEELKEYHEAGILKDTEYEVE